MFQFSAQQRLTALCWLSLFHVLVIISSNYLVQLPITIFGFHTTWGAFTFPFIFLASDLTVRIFGAPLARRIILTVMVPALIASYLVSSLFYKGEWQGFSALSQVNPMVARIAAASLMAYVLGQILDVHVFNRLRQLKAWWVAPAASAVFGNLSDTIAFFFYRLLSQYRPVHGDPLDGNRNGGLFLQNRHQPGLLPADVRRTAQHVAAPPEPARELAVPESGRLIHVFM
ncbi:hypothetical protein OS42_23310 [Dickeya oryzae]